MLYPLSYGSMLPRQPVTDTPWGRAQKSVSSAGIQHWNREPTKVRVGAEIAGCTTVFHEGSQSTPQRTYGRFIVTQVFPNDLNGFRTICI